MKSEPEARAIASRGEWLPEPQSNEPYWTFDIGQVTPYIQNGGVIITQGVARGMNAEGYKKLFDKGNKFFPFPDAAWEYLMGIVKLSCKQSWMVAEDLSAQWGKVITVLEYWYKLATAECNVPEWKRDFQIQAETIEIIAKELEITLLQK